MMLTELLLFIHIAIVYGRNVHYQQTYEQVPSYTEPIVRTNKENDGDRRLREREKFSSINADVQVQRAVVHRGQVIEQAINLFTNEQIHQNFNGKYKGSLYPNAQSEAIIFIDNVDYSREPFTNKRSEYIKYNNEPKTEPSGTLHSQTQANRTYTQVAWNAKSNTLPKVEENALKLKHVKNTPNYKNTEEATLEEVELDNRVAFTADECATGYTKVNGKCVKIQK